MLLYRYTCTTTRASKTQACDELLLETSGSGNNKKNIAMPASSFHAASVGAPAANGDGEKELHPDHSRRRLPHFIIIGVKKCGTRALLNFLNMHPHIVTASHEV